MSCACCRSSRPGVRPRPCELGCAAAGATDEDTLARARAYGEKLGLAFQIEDDILDIEGDAATLGKSIGKDAASEKSTFPSLLGLEECRELAAKLTEEAVDAVKPLDGHAFLVELARSLTGRTREDAFTQNLHTFLEYLCVLC